MAELKPFNPTRARQRILNEFVPRMFDAMERAADAGYNEVQVQVIVYARHAPGTHAEKIGEFGDDPFGDEDEDGTPAPD